MLKKYNDEQFKKVINSLKGLPQISAPEDFDINLKRKLNTIEPLPLPKRVRYHQYSRTLVPAFSLVVAVFLFFLVISNQNSPELNNPFLKAPTLRALNKNQQDVGNKKDQIKISDNDVVFEEQPAVPGSSNLSAQTSNSLNEKNDVSNSRKKFLELITSNSDENNVDKSLSARPGNAIENNGNGSTVNFNGFNITQDEDQVMQALRAKMDSLKKLPKEKNK
jgi:hypothetical protein